MEARQATDGDVRSLASALARAFHDDPVMTGQIDLPSGPPVWPMWRDPA